jgi:hypothetical protein
MQRLALSKDHITRHWSQKAFLEQCQNPRMTEQYKPAPHEIVAEALRKQLRWD